MLMTHTRQVDVHSRSRRATVAPFQVRGRFFTAIVLQIAGPPGMEFYTALDAILGQAPHFFTNAPFVLDLNDATRIDASFDFLGLMRELRKRRLTLIGVQNGTIAQNRAAVAAGLIALQGGCDVPPEGKNGKIDADGKDGKIGENGHVAAAADEEPPNSGLLVTVPVRSGQRVFSELGDLVVVASVGSGAELIARGNIHVYGPMRGRALAGVNGDPTARIFCQSLEAELIAINGLYRISDDIDPAFRRRRVQAFLKDGALCIEPLK